MGAVLCVLRHEANHRVVYRKIVLAGHPTLDDGAVGAEQDGDRASLRAKASESDVAAVLRELLDVVALRQAD